MSNDSHQSLIVTIIRTLLISLLEKSCVAETAEESEDDMFLAEKS